MTVALFVVPALFVVMGLVVIVLFVRERAWWREFVPRAVTVPGEITASRARRRTGSSAVDIVWVHQVSFPLPDGGFGDAWTRYASARQLPVGSRVMLQVDPAQPRRVVLAGDPGIRGWGGFVMGIVFVLVGLAATAVAAALA